jgi:RHS repeat-associated protein
MFRRLAGAFLAILVSVAVISVVGGEPPSRAIPNSALAEALWTADTAGIHRVSLADGTVALTLPEAVGARAVAVDPARMIVWAWTGRTLLALGFDGSRQLTLALDLPDTVHADLAVRPDDGSVWLASGHELRSLSAAGEPLGSWRLPETAVTLALDPDASLIWVATAKGVAARDAVSGEPVRTLDLGRNPDVRGLALTSSGNLWIALRDEARLLGMDGALLRTVAARNLAALAAATDGGAWLADAKSLLRINTTGSSLFVLEPFGSQGTITALAAHPTDGSVWAASGPSLAKVDASGQVVLRVNLAADVHLRDLALFADGVPPGIEIRTPLDGALLNRPSPEIEVAWSDVGTGADPSTLELRLDGATLAALCERRNDGASCAPAAPLSEGLHRLTATLRDFAGNQAALDEVGFSIDTIPPVITLTRPLGDTVLEDPALTIEGTVSEPAVLTLGGTEIPVGTDGSFVHGPVLLQEGANTFSLAATDRAGNRGALAVSVTYEPPAGNGLPPDPATVAPALDRTVATDLYTSVEFLWTGRRPVQTGMVPGAIDPLRVSVLRGRVLTRDGQSLEGARISVLGHPELGVTLSRVDGAFDLALNGGGFLTIQIEKAGHLTAHRQTQVAWRDWTVLDDVSLVSLDPAATILASGAAELQIAQGSRVEDEDGVRRSTLLVPAGTQARLFLADGTTQPLPALTVRATEYTVGPHGPRAMPASLPPSSAYTYAVELSVDEAIAIGAREVVFDRPLAHYLENFLGFPVGSAVPSGYYDRTLAAWIPSDNGRVVQVLGITAGLADLDVDGTGTPADPSALAALGVSEDERRALASLYAPGQSLWRVPIAHFTPWDHNWPFEPPEDAEPPEPDEPETEEPEEEVCEQPGSIIECQNQVLGEELPVTGTPLSLVYRSDRVPGRKTAHTLRLPLSGGSVPASLKHIELKISIAGRSFAVRYPAAPEQVHEFTWDGYDAYARLLQGRQPVKVEIGYVYDGVYGNPLAGARSFGRPGSSFGVNVSETRSEITFWRTFESILGQWSAQPLGFGGWTLSAQHAYDPRGALQRGDGGRILGTGPLDQILSTVAGSPTTAGYSADGPASGSLLYYPESVAVDPQGNVYVAERTRIRRIDRATGRITTIAGKTYGDYSGDGGPAIQAELNYPRGLVIDAAGNLYFSDTYNNRIRKITPAGFITTVAGTGEPGYNGDDMPARSAKLYQPWDLALDAQGNLYIADSGNHRLRRVTPDGWIETVGNGIYPWGGYPGRTVQLETPSGLAVAADGSIYVALRNRHIVFRIDPSGTAWHVAGNGSPDFSGAFTRDGVPATQTYLSYPGDVTVDSAGNLYITSYNQVRRVGPTGLITRVAGGGQNPGDGIFAASAQSGADGLAFDGQGTLYIAGWHRVRKVTPSLPNLSLAEIPIASPDGAEVWVFDGYGRHLRSLDSLTGSLRLRFHYDTAGRLAEIEDTDGLRTRIERGGGGQALALVGPFGQRTELTYENGYLASIRNPAGETVRFATTPEGLLTSLTDPRNGVYAFAYDALGRLRRDTDPAGGFKAVTRTPQEDAYRVDLSTAEGRTTSYTVEKLDTGERRWSNTSPAGLTSETLFRKDGSRRSSFPDGTVVTETPGPDPRFGMQAPVTKSLQVRTPAGLTWNLSSERTATWAASNTTLQPDTLQETVRINGRTYTSSWNATQRRFTLTTPVGRRRTLDLDAKGRPVALQVGHLAPTTFSYDTAGRLTEVVQGTGADRRILAFGYDAEGWLKSLTDPLSRSLLFDRDATGRVLRQTLPDTRDIAFSYDPSGNVTGITPPGRPVHNFNYTAVDLQEAYRPPDVGISRVDTTYHYDQDRRLTSFERPDGKTVTLGHDGAGRLTTLDLSRGQITYTYDTAGRLSSLSAPGGQSLTYTYDGSLLTRTTWTGPVAGSVERTYDSNFRVIAEKVNGGTPVTYQYDADGLLVKAGDLTITRDPQTGLVTGTTLGVVTTNNAYNPFGELIRQEAKVSGNPVFTADYTRDLLGRITHKVEVIEGITDTWDYQYDQAGRLEEVHRNGLFLSRYVYDSNGNRLAHITPTGTVTATYDDQDRLLTYGDAAYTYTANGELSTKTQNGQTTRYEYDELGNLVKVALPDGVEIEYVIDGQGRRVGKRVGGVLAAGWLYKDQLNAAAELDSSGSLASGYVSANSETVAYVFAAAGLYRVISDPLGSPRILLDSRTGAIIQRLDFQEFGEALSISLSGEPLGFAAGRSDSHLSLTRFGRRDYDPLVGRWTSRDPALFLGGDTNLYSYTGNDPINQVDPSGLAPGDKHYGLPREFWTWYHQQHKKGNPPDLNKEEADRWHKNWETEGKPNPKADKRRTDNRRSSCEILEPLPFSPPPLNQCRTAGIGAGVVIGGVVGGVLGGAGGTLVAPGPGTVGGGALGVQEGIVLGGIIGGIVGDLLSPAMCN